MSLLDELCKAVDRNGGAHLSLHRTTHGTWVGGVYALDLDIHGDRCSYKGHHADRDVQKVAEALLDVLNGPGVPLPDLDAVLDKE